jgi:hypothetical protein
VRFEPSYVSIINLHFLCYGSEVIHFECVYVWMNLKTHLECGDPHIFNVFRTL